MRRIRIATLGIAAAVLLAGCGVSYDTDLMASLEGRWMCDVQRYTFDEVGDIQAELDSRLAGNGVSAEQYRAFKDDLTKQPGLREMVDTELIAYCDTGS
jgi:hypothetical protein